MKILLVNDDGIESKRLWFAKTALERYGEVWVVAPRTQQSGVSMAISIGQIPYEKRDDRTYVIDGTPVDCVSFGIHGLKLEPDLVVSGINYGYNLGSDITYSGTVSAALQATYYGYPAVAFSAHYAGEESIKKYFKPTMDHLFERKFLSIHYACNVNFPKDDIEKYKGIFHTFPYNRTFTLVGELTSTHFNYKREFEKWSVIPKLTDVFAVKNGKVSISRVFYQRKVARIAT